MADKKWSVAWLAAPDTPVREAHVRPQDDGFDHEFDPDCGCGPAVIPVEREDGSVGWVYRHASLDGRELREITRG